MGFFDQLNHRILALPTGIIYLLVLLGAGIFLTFRLRFVQFRHFFRAFRESLGSLKQEGAKSGFSSFQAAATALAGTLGTGNIVGVATAIVSGGPGAVFWMVISSFLGMAVKFAEIVLAVCFRTQNQKGEPVGGPMYYIEKGLGSRLLAILFAVACVGASFGVGNLSQANAVSEAFATTFFLPKWMVGAAVTMMVGLVIVGGVRRIGAVTERLVPLMAMTYFIGAAVAVAINVKALPCVLEQILADAFAPTSISGGVLGFLTGKAVRFGISRSVFSNEAGLGSAPIAHGAAQTDSPVRQGLWGVVEVFLDTTLMCTLTAAVILTSGQYQTGSEGTTLTLRSFEATLGSSAAAFVAISTAFFAIASIIGWSYYGEKAMEFLSPQQPRWVTGYRICFAAAIFLGSVVQSELIFNLSDLLNLLMAVPNLVAVIALSGRVRAESDRYFKKSTKSLSKSTK